jgi:hypothetical protein
LTVDRKGRAVSADDRTAGGVVHASPGALRRALARARDGKSLSRWTFFTGPDVEQAIPYGIYDIMRNTGWVNVGVDHDTSVFAVESIRCWWKVRGSQDYPAASRLLITAGAGGSNSYRCRVWKSELAALAAETGLAITVCHFPPGTSKWNKIEHRLFSHITMNWRGRPLTSHEVVVQTIAATRTSSGLCVEAVSAKAPPVSVPAPPAARKMLHKLGDERLTGMTSAGLARLSAALAPLQGLRAEARLT